MNDHDAKPKADGAESLSTAGLGARPINCDQVAWMLNAIERYIPPTQHPRVSRAREMQKYALLYELMEVAHLYFEDTLAQHNGTPGDVRRFQYASKAAEAGAWNIARQQAPNAPHEGPGAASSRTVPLDGIVGRRRPERTDMELVAKLRYMGRQYANGQAARGGGQQKHYLEEAADEIEALRAKAARWDAIETLMILGDVELTQTEDGGYSIYVEPVENILPTSWNGDTPDQVADKVAAQLTTPNAIGEARPE